MLDVAGNYPSNNKYKDSTYVEVPGLRPGGEGGSRGDADLGHEPGLVDFFHKVMGRRREMKWD